MTISKKKVKTYSVNLLRYIILGGLSFIILYPVIISLLISFMQTTDVTDVAIRFFSRNPTFENYTNAILFLDYWKTVLVSILFDCFLSGVEVLVCLLVAYGFARFDFPFKNFFFILAMLTLLIPYQIYFTPLYIFFNSIEVFGTSLLKTPLPMFLLSFTCVGLKDALLIYIMRQSFKSYPFAIEEAATVDGAGTFKVFTKIMLPGATSVSMTCFMFAFVWKWTDPSFTDVFLPKAEFIWTMLANIGTKFNEIPQATDYYYLSLLRNSSIILFMIPLFLIFMFCKKFLVESVATTGLVG